MDEDIFTEAVLALRGAELDEQLPRRSLQTLMQELLRLRMLKSEEHRIRNEKRKAQGTSGSSTSAASVTGDGVPRQQWASLSQRKRRKLRLRQGHDAGASGMLWSQERG